MITLPFGRNASALQFQQCIALLHGTGGFGGDRCILVGVADDQRRGDGIALGLDGLDVKADQRLALAHLVALIDEVGEVLSAQLDGVDANVHQQLRAVNGGHAHRVVGVEGGRDLAVGRSHHGMYLLSNTFPVTSSS